MTENEAKKNLETLERFYRIAKSGSALHEVLINFVTLEDLVVAIKALEAIQQYRAIGTIEEFKDLKEKNEPKKIDIWANGEEHCPFCDKNLTTFYGFANCFSCGQKLDWQ